MRKNSWFERNPGKTITLLLLIGFLFLTYSAEKLLAYKSKGIGFNFALPDRAVRLREYRPTMKQYFIAGREDSDYDNLVIKQYLMRIDKDGFIMPSAKYAKPDISLAFLGASTTECRYVDEEHRFPYLSGVLLEKELGIKINAYNAARSGNHTLHSLNIFLNKVIPVHPQVAVMMHNINDLVILLYEKTYWNQNSHKSVIIDMNKEIVNNYFKVLRDRYIPNLSRALWLFSNNIRLWLKSGDKPPGAGAEGDEFGGVRSRKLSVDKAYMLGQFEMNLQTFIYACRARGIVPVLMTMANRFKEHPDEVIARHVATIEARSGVKYRQFKDLFDSFNEAIRKKAQENDIPLIDLARDIPQEKEYMYDVVHYTDRGSQRAAEILKERLGPIIKAQLHPAVAPEHWQGVEKRQ